jgi:cytochrome c oxidase subunit 4
MEHGHKTHDDLEGTQDDHAPEGVGKYVAVFVALCLLTALSFAVGNSHTLRVNAPAAMWAMMMAISCAKALMVILFFMHLKWEANWKYVLTVPASLMSVFLVIMLVPDVGNRTRHYSPDRWLYAATPGSGHGESGGEHTLHDPSPSLQSDENIDSPHATSPQ